MAKFAVFLTLCTVCSFYICVINANTHSLIDVINALVKIVDYCKSTYQHLNFEAHFGLRVVEGQFKLILSEYNDEKHRLVPAAVMTQIRHLAGEASKVANMAVPHLAEYNPQAFNTMKNQVNKPWNGSHTHRLIDSNLQWDSSTLKRQREITEEEKNTCVSELTHGEEKGRNKCLVSLDCLQRMTTRGQHGFSLQHQIFYSSLIEQVGCGQTMNGFLQAQSSKNTLEYLQRELCSNAYYELERTISFYGIQPSFKNLFLLNEFNCPSLGFFQFLSIDWLNLILSWQTASGCIIGGFEHYNEPGTADKLQSINFPDQKVVDRNVLKPDLNIIHTNYAGGRQEVNEGQQQNQFEGLPIEIEQKAWFPNSNYRMPNKFNSFQSHRLEAHENLKKFDATSQDHLLAPGAALEIAHGTDDKRLEIRQSDHIAANDVREVVHDRNYGLNSEEILHQNLDSNPRANPLAFNSAFKDSKIPQSPFQRRSLLKYTKSSNDDDDGYFFDRDKHIGANDTNEKHTYLYYYPMYEQIKRMKESKEKRKLKLAEKRKTMMTTSRKLLKEVSTGNCNLQMTGLTLSALAMYVRYLVDPGPPEFHGIRLNKPDGQYDLGIKDSLEEDEPTDPVYISNRGDDIAMNADKELSALKELRKFRNNGLIPPVKNEFKPIYFGDVRKKLHPEENYDFVRRAETHKDLIDRAFEIKIRRQHEIHSTERETILKTSKNINRSRDETHNTPSNKIGAFNAFFSGAQITAIHKHLQTDLGYHLIVIVIISLICLFVLYRYMKLRYRVRHRTKYV